MHSSLRHAVLSACLVVAAGCGDSDASGGGLDKLGSDLKSAGEKAATETKEAGSAMSKQLSEAGTAIEKLAVDAKTSMSMKGDELAKLLKSKQGDLDSAIASVKAQLNAKGGAFKDMAANLTTKNEGLKKAIDALAAGGAAAGADLKQAAMDAYTAIGTELKAAIAKLNA